MDELDPQKVRELYAMLYEVLGTLTPEQAGALAQPPELVRWGPSAVNKQPCRAVNAGDAVHFYLKHIKG